MSLRGTGRELGRGAVNLGLCWLEIPCAIDKEIRDADDDAISFALATAFGTIEGGFQAFNRAAGGAFEILLSPFPPYDPIMRPALPPYLPRRPARRQAPKPEHAEPALDDVAEGDSFIRIDLDDGERQETPE